MKTATRRMTWMTSKGKATAIITVNRGIEISTNKSDWGVKVDSEIVIAETNVSVTINGMDVVFEGRPVYDPRLPKEYAARIGNSQLAIDHAVHAEMLALIADATTDAELDTDYADYCTRENKAAAADAEYQMHHNSIVSAMAK